MKKENGGQRFDDDILRCKEEIFRLKNVVPPFGRPPKRTDMRQEPESSNDRFPLPDEKTVQPVIDMPPEPIEAAAESIEQTAVQTIVEEAAPQPTLQEYAFEPEPDDIDAKEDSHEETEPLVEDSSILAALEAEAATTDPAPEPEPQPEPELESEPEPESDESEIPEFNLAEQIMAAQRKIVGNRRKGPGNARFEIKEVEQETPTPTADIQPPLKPTPVNIPHPPAVAATPAAPIRIVAMEPPMSPQQKVIAEIVARDINKFYQTRKVS